VRRVGCSVGSGRVVGATPAEAFARLTRASASAESRVASKAGGRSLPRLHTVCARPRQAKRALRRSWNRPGSAGSW